MRDDFLNIADKAHIEHPVRFIKHQIFDLAEIDMALVHKIEQAARCCNQDIDTGDHCLNLRLGTCPAIDQGAFQMQVFRIGLDILGNLYRQLPRWRKDQGAGAFRCALALSGQKFLDQGKREGGGFTGARLRNCDQVFALHHGGNRLFLDGSHGFIAALFDSAKDGLVQTEVCKFCHYYSYFPAL